MPSVEGMVATTRWSDTVLIVVLLSPLFKKSEGTWADAALIFKSAASLTKKTLPSYEFPFPTDPRSFDEVRKANGNLEMLKEVVVFLNKSHSISHEASTFSRPTRTAWELQESEAAIENQEHSNRLSLQLMLSQHDETTDFPDPPIAEKLINKLVEQISKRLNITNSEQQKQKPKEKKSLKIKLSTSASSSSSSSDSKNSDSSSSSDDENVGMPNEDGNGWFTCLFNVADLRSIADPKKKMQGKNEERMYIRKALLNIYSDFSTLKAFIDTVRTESLSSASKPYNSDIIWLSFHATYLDLILLHSVDGPWKAWNELSVDCIAKPFFELLIRASPNRAYPDILDESVRKWMKRKRVGLSTHFGAIPNYLVGAKITDSGIHPKGGWETRNTNKNFSPSTSVGGKKSQNVGSEKK